MSTFDIGVLFDNLSDNQNDSKDDITPNISINSDNEEGNSGFKDYLEYNKLINNTDSYSDNESKIILFCPCGCSSTVIIEVINKKEANIICEKGSKKVKISDIEDYFHPNNFDMNGINNVYNLHCLEHKNKDIINKHKSHCINCNIDLCEDCILSKRCENHDFIILDLDYKKKDYFKFFIKKHDKTEDNDENIFFCKLIKALLYTNEEYPNIRTLKSLENVYDFFKFLDKINKNSIYENKENSSKSTEIQKGEKIEMDKNFIFIKKKSDLTKKKLLNSVIEEINMDKQNFRNLKLLSSLLDKNRDYNFLKKLVLSGNNLKTIKHLVNKKSKHCVFSNLEHLDLSRNFLGDENIAYIEKLNCNNLKTVYLYTNMFTDYTIFNMLKKNFKELELLYIGFNRFIKNVEKLEEIIFEKKKKIGLTYVFNEDNYENFGKFNLKNLEELYIQSNGISNLDIFEKMNLPNVKEIYLINNELEEVDINFLKKFSKLERLYLCDSISKIVNFNITKDLKNFEYCDINSNKLKLDILEKNELTIIKGIDINL